MVLFDCFPLLLHFCHFSDLNLLRLFYRQKTGGGNGGTAYRVLLRFNSTYHNLTFIYFSNCSGRRKWQPTPVFLPGESQGWRSLVGCRLWGCTESDTTEVTQKQRQPLTLCVCVCVCVCIPQWSVILLAFYVVIFTVIPPASITMFCTE